MRENSISSAGHATLHVVAAVVVAVVVLSGLTPSDATLQKHLTLSTTSSQPAALQDAFTRDGQRPVYI